MEMRRRLLMSIARSLATKKSAPRIGSVTSATWNSCVKVCPLPRRSVTFFFPRA